MYDYIIRNGTVIDGTAIAAFSQDICIKHDRIAHIGKCDAEAVCEVDATGLVITPGFIDMHSHTDLEYLRAQPPVAKVLQGVTTEVLGQDGLGVAPVAKAHVPLVQALTAGLLGRLPEQSWRWGSFGEYLDVLAERGIPNNAAVLASHGPLRIAAMGMHQRQADRHELLRMQQMLEQTLDQGAFGLSTGLIYPPCSYSSTQELIDLNRIVGSHNAIFVVHQRDEGYHLPRSFDEVTHVARESGAHLHISHLQAYGKMNWPLIDIVLEKAQRFCEEGYTLSWDRYPYLAGSTVLSAVLPDWTLSSGTDALVANLKQPAYRQRIHEQFKHGLDVWNNRAISCGWENIVVSQVTSDQNRWMEGRDIRSLSDACAKHPVDFVCDLLAEEQLAVTMISHYGSEEVLEKVLKSDLATCGSDGIFGGRPHPRLYGTFPRFIRSLVYEKKALDLPKAVHKLTALAASILGLKDRGSIREGHFADLVLFDPANLRDLATYENPCQPPSGIEYVFVNGIPVVDPDGFTGRLGGRVLYR